MYTYFVKKKTNEILNASAFLAMFSIFYL